VQEDGLEAALATTQERVDAALRSAAVVSRALKKARTSAIGGQVRDLRKALDAAVVASEELSGATKEAQASLRVGRELSPFLG
jgi:hypothetical protein